MFERSGVGDAGSPVSGPVRRVAGELGAAVAAGPELVGLLAEGLTAGQLAEVLAADVAVLVACRASLDAVLAARLAAAERVGVPERVGAGSLVAWVRGVARCTAGEAGRLVGLARTCGAYPTVADALGAARLTGEHARLIGRTLDRLPEPARPHAARLLVDQAGHRDPAELLTAVATPLIDRLLPDAALRDPETLHQARRFTASRTLYGMVDVHGLLDPATGEALLAALDERTAPLPDDTRTAPQRRADALGELARHATRPDPRPGPDPTGVLLIVDVDRLTDRLGPDRLGPDRLGPDRPVDPADPADPVRTGPRPAWSRTGDAFWPDLLAACCDATLTRLVLGPATTPINLGRATRQWSPAQRRALTIRDRHCVWPDCHRPPGWCDIDHIIPWQAGGPTDIDNARLLCRYHHQLRHDGWHLDATPAGRWQAHPPADWDTRLHHRRKHRTPPARAA